MSSRTFLALGGVGSLGGGHCEGRREGAESVAASTRMELRVRGGVSRLKDRNGGKRFPSTRFWREKKKVRALPLSLWAVFPSLGLGGGARGFAERERARESEWEGRRHLQRGRERASGSHFVQWECAVAGCCGTREEPRAGTKSRDSTRLHPTPAKRRQAGLAEESSSSCCCKAAAASKPALQHLDLALFTRQLRRLLAQNGSAPSPAGRALRRPPAHRQHDLFVGTSRQRSGLVWIPRPRAPGWGLAADLPALHPFLGLVLGVSHGPSETADD